MTNLNKQLAKVSSARLEIQDRGLLSFYIQVDYENGLSQSVGGICLDEYNKKTKQRVGTAYGCEVIRRLLLQMSVNDFSEMKGKYMWVLGDGDGLSFTPRGVQALNVDKTKEKPVIFDEILKQFK